MARGSLVLFCCSLLLFARDNERSVVSKPLRVSLRGQGRLGVILRGQRRFEVSFRDQGQLRWLGAAKGGPM